MSPSGSFTLILQIRASRACESRHSGISMAIHCKKYRLSLCCIQRKTVSLMRPSKLHKFDTTRAHTNLALIISDSGFNTPLHAALLWPDSEASWTPSFGCRRQLTGHGINLRHDCR